MKKKLNQKLFITFMNANDRHIGNQFIYQWNQCHKFQLYRHCIGRLGKSFLLCQPLSGRYEFIGR
jgi:hypothetical protein